MAAMYTKMTSTGSSLIVNPRTISKELEARITASIAAVVAKHDAAKLTTKLVRQAVEKDVHVSLANHKELLKRLMHQEFRKLKAAKVRLLLCTLAVNSNRRDSRWTFATGGQARRPRRVEERGAQRRRAPRYVHSDASTDGFGSRSHLHARQA